MKWSDYTILSLVVIILFCLSQNYLLNGIILGSLLFLLADEILFDVVSLWAWLTWEQGQGRINEQFARLVVPSTWKLPRQFYKDISPEVLKKLRDDPVLFARAILPDPSEPDKKIQPYPYQEKWLRDLSKRLIAICGRQVGKSTIAAVALIHFAATHPKTTSIVVSSTLRQSMETFDKVVGFLLDSPLKKSIFYKSRTRIILSNGARIVCLPCGRYGWSLRGYTVHFAVLDEAAFMPEDVIANVVFPMLATTNGRLWMMTTPWSKDHITYRAFMDTEGWSVYHLPSSISPKITKAFLNEQLKLIGEERFRLEYLAEFVDDARAYFPMTLLRMNLHICEEAPCPFCAAYGKPEGGKDLYGGYDPGGKESYAAFVVVDRAGKLQVRFIDQEKIAAGEDERFCTRYTVKIADIHKRARLRKIGVDQTGIGAPILAHMKKLGLPVEGYQLTLRVKEELASRARIALENKDVELPNDLALLNALNCIEYDRTHAGGYTFSHRQGTYDDLGWAFMLALAVASEAPSGGGIVIVAGR